MILAGMIASFIVWVAIWLVCAAFTAALAYAHARSGFGWFLLGLLFGPFALLVVIFLVVFFPIKPLVSQLRTKLGYTNNSKSRTELGYTDDSDPL